MTNIPAGISGSATACLDGTGWITIDGQTLTVETDSLDAAIAALVDLARVYTDGTGHDLELLARIEGGSEHEADYHLLVHPDGTLDSLDAVSPADEPAPTPASPRRRPALALAGVVVLALATVSGGAWWATADEQSPAVVPAAAASKSLEPSPISTTPTPSPTVTQPTLATVVVRVSTKPSTARFALVADQSVTAQLTVQRPGNPKSVKDRTVRLRAGVQSVVKLSGMHAGRWQWRARGDGVQSMTGGLTVPTSPTPTQSPTTRPSAPPSPTPTPTPAPTYTPPPPPKPTKKPDSGGNGPRGNGTGGPIDSGSTDGPIDPNERTTTLGGTS